MTHFHYATDQLTPAICVQHACPGNAQCAYLVSSTLQQHLARFTFTQHLCMHQGNPGVLNSCAVCKTQQTDVSWQLGPQLPGLPLLHLNLCHRCILVQRCTAQGKRIIKMNCLPDYLALRTAICRDETHLKLPACCVQVQLQAQQRRFQAPG